MRTRLSISLAEYRDEDTKRAEENADYEGQTALALLGTNHCGDYSAEYPQKKDLHNGVLYPSGLTPPTLGTTPRGTWPSSW
jgi:hypothetical protein